MREPQSQILFEDWDTHSVDRWTLTEISMKVISRQKCTLSVGRNIFEIFQQKKTPARVDTSILKLFPIVLKKCQSQNFSSIVNSG